MAEYKHLRNEVVSNIRKSQQDYYKKKISPDNKPQNIWKAVNESLGKDKKSKLPNDISPDEWNNHFTSVGPKLAKKHELPLSLKTRAQIPTQIIIAPSQSSDIYLNVLKKWLMCSFGNIY